MDVCALLSERRDDEDGGNEEVVVVEEQDFVIVVGFGKVGAVADVGRLSSTLETELIDVMEEMDALDVVLDDALEDSCCKRECLTGGLIGSCLFISGERSSGMVLSFFKEMPSSNWGWLNTKDLLGVGTESTDLFWMLV